jgi:hypothetical protein
MENLKKIKEVKAADQYLAVMVLLNELGYSTSQLTVMDVAVLKHDIIKAIEVADKLELVKSDDQVTRY